MFEQNICLWFATNQNLSDIWYHDRWSVIIPQKFSKRKPIHAKNLFCNRWSTTGTFCVLLLPPMEPVNLTRTFYNDLRVWYDLVLFKFKSQFFLWGEGVLWVGGKDRESLQIRALYFMVCLKQLCLILESNQMRQNS